MTHSWMLITTYINAAAMIPAAADIPYLVNETYAVDQGSYGGYPNQTFRSTPIVGPLVEASSFHPDAADKAPHILLTGGTYGVGNGIILLRSDDLSLVYSNTIYNESLNADVQTYNGTDYLTIWSGYLIENNYAGHVQMYDSHYDMKYNFSTQRFRADCDMHDFVLTGEGTAILLNYDKVYPYDLSFMRDGRVDDELRDSCFQELDIATQQVLFTWCLRDHWQVNDTYVTIENFGRREGGGGFDFGHINSVQKTSEGNYLVSFRHLCAVLMIRGKGEGEEEGGNIIWHLGGSRNDFQDLSDGRATDFRFQHDARFPPLLEKKKNDNTTYMTLFDNASAFESKMNQTGGDDEDDDDDDRARSSSSSTYSRVMHLELDCDAMTVKLLREDRHPKGLLSQAMGGASYLPHSGNTLVSWGFQPSITEHAPSDDDQGGSSTVVLDIQFGPYDWYRRSPQIYRAKKVHWLGYPSWSPSIAAGGSSSPDDEDKGPRGVYMSWNGATEYTQWAVLAGDSAQDLDGGDKLVDGKFFPRSGFETFVSLDEENNKKRYVRAAALNADGRILGSTDVMDMNTGETMAAGRSVTDVVSEGRRPGGGGDDDGSSGTYQVNKIPYGLLVGIMGLSVVLGIIGWC